MEKTNFETIKPIPDRPRLRYIEKTLTLLETEKGPDGKDINWKDLYEKIDDWESSLALSDKIRKVVRDYLTLKFPTVKEKIPSIENLPDDELLDAINNGWFEEIGEEVGGTRKEVLLAVLAHIARRMETRIYKKIVEQSSEKELKKLGLDNISGNLLIDIMETSVKSDPLFIRFLAYSQLGPETPDNPNKVAPIGQDGKPHTVKDLFPHESQFISKRFKDILDGYATWQNIPGSEEFKKYLELLSQFFDEQDPDKAKDIQKEAEIAYGKCLQTEFPIILVPPLEGYYKPPYLDPELRVAIRTPECKVMEKHFEDIQSALADNIYNLNIGQFSENMRNKPIRMTVSFGAYGAGITFNAVAQEDPAIMMYVNEQIRSYDTNLKNSLQIIDLPQETFSSTSDERILEMSKEDTMMHEFSHAVYPPDTHEAQRLGPEAESIISEICAESIYRGVAREMLASNKMAYTPEQFFGSTLAMPLQVLENFDPDDEYVKAATFVLNGLFEQGLVEFDGQKIKIHDKDKLFNYFRNNALEIIGLYEDPETTPEKAKRWISKNCKPGSKLRELIEFLKSQGSAK